MHGHPRVLCLHGRHQTAVIFQDRLARLRRSDVRLDLVFVDGPAEVVTGAGDVLRGWRPEGSEDDWSLAEEVLRRAWAELGPFDGVLGFSEGAQAAHFFCRLHASQTVEPPLFGLRFAIFAGGLPAKAGAGGVVCPHRLSIPSIHFASASDPVVSLATCTQLAEAFHGARLEMHEDGHVFPQKREQLDALANFLSSVPPRESVLGLPAGCMFCGEEQQEEVEALQEMLCVDGELVRLGEGWPIRLRVRFAEEAFLDFLLPPGYPQQCKCVVALYTQRFEVEARVSDLMERLEDAHEPLGSPSIFSLAMSARDWGENDLASVCLTGGTVKATTADVSGDEDEEEEDESGWWKREEVDETQLHAAEECAAKTPRTTSARIAGAAGYGRPWQYVVGLVGKPSAGKSTFFNAVCQLEPGQAAAMAAHPFTTIEPNTAPGWFAAPCPSAELGITADTEHGAAPGGRRRLPLFVKDVAGLVPGAYQGQGRGNAFLNDLCDADALVHVVDASGRTDRQGVDQGDEGRGLGDPLGDINWVRREIHLWMFTNVRGKWDSVRKRARMGNHEAREATIDRLTGLFTGYRMPKPMVLEALSAAALPPHDLADPDRGVRTWAEADLHRLVAFILRMRFPMVIALNKADHPDASAHIARVREAVGESEICVSCSARTELQLVEARRDHYISYEDGGSDAIAMSNAPAAVVARLEGARNAVLGPLGSTGVLEAISASVMLRSPTFIYCVADFTSCAGVCVEGKRGGVLCSALVLRPQSTVEEAFSALKTEGVVAGEFVRAELLKERSPAVSHRVAKKEDRLGPGTQVLRVVTSKKAAWQKHGS